MNKWVTVWGTAASIAERRPETYAKNITLRYPVKCAFAGNAARLHFSNFCGTEPVTLDRVTVAPAVSARQIDAEKIAAVTFGGKRCVTIDAGGEIFSDEIEFPLSALETVSVSIYLKNFTLMRSAVTVTGPLSGGFFSLGDCTESETLPQETTRSVQIYYFFTGLDVLTEDKNRAVICYGDSISAQSWVGYLAERFMSDKDNRTAVVRRAASGTRVLREYSCITYESYGLCGRRRFEREISSISGADAVVIQQGINDIIHPVGTKINPFRPMSDLPTAEQLAGGIDYYLSVAEKHGLTAYLGTLTPIYGWRTYAPFRDEIRNEFNDLLRGKSCALCIDFDKILRSDANTAAFADGYDSGDHLHPSETAYKAMAEFAYSVLKNG